MEIFYALSKFNANNLSKITSSDRSLGQPYAAKTASSSLLPYQVKQVDEMLLVSLLFARTDALPFADEILRRKGHKGVPIRTVMLVGCYDSSIQENSARGIWKSYQYGVALPKWSNSIL